MVASYASSGAVVLSGLSKSYGEVRAVRSVDLAVAPGESLALLGPNGAGKTTIIDTLLGLTRPDSGVVSIFGMSTQQAAAAGVVGAMLQTGSLIPNLNVRELLAMVASLYPRPLEVDEVLRLTAISQLAGRRTNNLSGGETQRVRYALALVGDPDLLLLDEPTVALDVEARQQLWAAMPAAAGRGKTVIFATHYLEEADAYADRVVVLAGGEVVADGPTTEIKARVVGRTIRATLPDADMAELPRLSGVTSADRRGASVILVASEPEAALRALLDSFPAARDIEVRGAGLEEAFLALTTSGNDVAGEPQEIS